MKLGEWKKAGTNLKATLFCKRDEHQKEMCKRKVEKLLTCVDMDDYSANHEMLMNLAEQSNST